MIITQFKGGVGNQLLQYAAAKQFAIRGKTELKFDMRNYDYGPGYVLDKFNIPQNIATPEESDRLKNKDWIYYFEKIKPYYKRRFVWERNGEYDENLVGLSRSDMYIRGNFQSVDYFKDIIPQIRSEFTLKNPLESTHPEIVQMVSENNSVSLHIRRGDIMVGAAAIDKPTVPLSYYEKAIATIAEKINKPQFFVFSDDPDWVKDNLKIDFPVFFISGRNLNDCEELMAMTYCHHHITANSTFSWWGAWLGENKDKITICPQKWFLDNNRNVVYLSHLLPKNWTII